MLFAVLLHLAEEVIIQDLSLGLSYLLALPNVSSSSSTHQSQCLCSSNNVRQHFVYSTLSDLSCLCLLLLMGWLHLADFLAVLLL